MNILLVDDDVLLRDTYEADLDVAGHQVSATDGVGALLALRGGGWDAILVDILMPGTDGIEVICAATGLAERPRIVAMSGGGRLSAQECLHMASMLGADACLRKPFEISALMSALDAS